MERAMIVGASGGLGRALSEEAKARGAEVVGLSRSGDGLDVTDEASVAQAFGRLDGTFDLVFVATGALRIGGRAPEKAIRQINADTLGSQFAVNAIAPALILKHSLRLMPRDRRSVFAVLSARVGSIGDNRLGGWYGYRAAKAAANQILRSAAVELSRSHKHAICVALHPGTVATPLTAGFVPPEKATQAPEAAAMLLDVIAGLSPSQTGGFFDYAGRRIPW